MTQPPFEDVRERSAIFRAEFGESWRAWSWVQRQFTPTSLSALGAVLIAGGGYVVHLRQDVAVVRERVVVLETRVVPVLQDQGRLEVLESKSDDHEKRITRLETNWDDAKAAAGTAPVPSKRRK